jgi:heme/copper-type cytochrome/quinol oxidase subunit 1
VGSSATTETWHGWPVRLIDGLTTAQRVVIVVAIGIAFTAVGIYLASLGSPRFGWYAYSPLARGFGPPGKGLAGWLRLIIWLGLTGLWALASVVVLRPRRDK